MMFLLTICMSVYANDEPNDCEIYGNGTMHSYKNHYKSIDCDTRNQLHKGILKEKYSYMACFREDLARVNQKDGSLPHGRFGFINKQGKLSVPMQFDKARGFSNGLAWVQQGEKKYFIDTQGKKVLDVSQYDEVGDFKNGLAAVFQNPYSYTNRKQSCIDKTGNLILPMVYTGVECDELAQYNQAQAFKNALSEPNILGVVDKQNRVLIPFEYHSLKVQKNNIYIAIPSNNCPAYFYRDKPCSAGLIDMNNQILLPFEYDRIDDFENGLAKIYKGKQWDIVNEKGQIIQELSDKPMPK